MEIVFFGTPDFSVEPLKTLHLNPNFKVNAVFTQPDKAVGRKKNISPPPVKSYALQAGIPVYQPKNKKELLELTSDIKCDFFVVIAYGMLIPNSVLQIPKISSINVHTSLLPKYRGASPIQEALLKGDRETGISIMKMDEHLDHGPVYFLKRIEISKEDNFITLSDKLSKESAKILPVILEDIKENNLKPLPQNHEKATFCHKIEKEDGKVIPETEIATSIFNKLRAFTPWPGIYLIHKGKKIKILQLDIEQKNSNNPPGTWFAEDKKLKIQTNNGIIIPETLQPEGKNPMNSNAFINGYL